MVCDLQILAAHDDGSTEDEPLRDKQKIIPRGSTAHKQNCTWSVPPELQGWPLWTCGCHEDADVFVDAANTVAGS